MKRNYYIFSNGRLERKDNTITFESEQGRKFIPVEDIDNIYLFGETDWNSKLINFLSQKQVTVHFFNYYGYYTGSFYPREFLNSGMLLVKQVQHYENMAKRMKLAEEFVGSAAFNIHKNLAYYHNRGVDLQDALDDIKADLAVVKHQRDIESLMALEGKMRKTYYETWEEIINEHEFKKRVRRPPDNIVNALISFGNSLVYTACLSEIYKTQLSPLISYLHEPGERRFSLSLDLAEIFKPIIADRIIFKTLNQKMLKEEHFDKKVNYCMLKENGRKIFVKEFDERLQTTVKHRNLGRNVSYAYLIRLECYKLIKHLLNEKEYNAFRMWW
ncbi:MAG: type I-B CRISPR-associated endonuclease Cas1 [Calditrichaceae bacterium]|nr:type I-B CRISPR-associated endonuclease Cas1 [Calditrichaceae bacterium]RQV93928.1 MAG: type I-B CRISPR-associated endonuclease Cas1 [Calditrichota bacterium]